jgi:hypothetical protein
MAAWANHFLTRLATPSRTSSSISPPSRLTPPFDLDINRRTKINTNASTNRGDAIIDTHGYALRWFGSLQGGPGSLRVINSGGIPGILILGTDKKAFVNPFGSALPAGTVNLTVQEGAIVQTSGTVMPTGGELGSETGVGGAVLAIKLDNGPNPVRVRRVYFPAQSYPRRRRRQPRYRRLDPNLPRQHLRPRAN